MKKMHRILGVLGICSASTITFSGSISSTRFFDEQHLILALESGYASINEHPITQSFSGADENIFTYTHYNNNKNTGFFGFFLGTENKPFQALLPDSFIQTGIEYTHFSSVYSSGMTSSGIEPQTSTEYSYNYKVQIQQLMGSIKLFTTLGQKFFPYGELGLGVAFNNTGQYQASTLQTGSLNLTPTFATNSLQRFSYNLGLGLGVSLTPQSKLVLGYRYSDFGTTALGGGRIVFNGYEYPTLFNLSNPRIHANQLIMQLSYQT